MTDSIWKNRPATVARKTKFFFFIALLPFTSGEANLKLHLQVRYAYSISVFLLEQLFPHVRDNWFSR